LRILRRIASAATAPGAQPQPPILRVREGEGKGGLGPSGSRSRAVGIRAVASSTEGTFTRIPGRHAHACASSSR
jgi:hypothetical protein